MTKLDKIEHKFRFRSYCVDRLEMVIAKDIYDTLDGRKTLKVGFSRYTRMIDQSSSEIGITCRISLVTPGTEVEAIRLNARIKGIFEVRSEEKIDDETMRDLCNRNAPSILFPYLRTFISNITGSAGITPIVLPVVNPSLIEMTEESFNS